MALDSDSHPLLISSLASSLARLGRLTDLGTLQYAPERRPVTAANSAYRVAALHGSWLAPDPAAVTAAGGPVLLVDDLSRQRMDPDDGGPRRPRGRRAGRASVCPRQYQLTCHFRRVSNTSCFGPRISYAVAGEDACGPNQGVIP